jgi:hypothetical protein
MKRPSGPVIWTEPARYPRSLGLAIVLVYCVVAAILASVALGW